MVEEYKNKWNHFVDYANKNGFSFYIGNLSFVSLKTGDILTLISDGKVAINKKNSAFDADFIMLEEKTDEDN